LNSSRSQGTLYGSGSFGRLRSATSHATRNLGEYNGYVSASGFSSVERLGKSRLQVSDVAPQHAARDKAALRIGPPSSRRFIPGHTDYVNCTNWTANGISRLRRTVIPLTRPASYQIRWKMQTPWHVLDGAARCCWEPNRRDVAPRSSTLRQIGLRSAFVAKHGRPGMASETPNGELRKTGSIQLEPSSRDINATVTGSLNFDLGFATLTSSTSHYDHSGESVSVRRTRQPASYGFRQASSALLQLSPPNGFLRSVTFATRRLVQKFELVSDGGESFDYRLWARFLSQQRSKGTQESFCLVSKTGGNAFLPFAASA